MGGGVVGNNNPSDADLEEFDSAVGIVADGVVGAAGGLVSTVLMTIVLLAVELLGAFSRESFAQLAGIVGLGERFPAVAKGYLVFLVSRMVPWPLLFASQKEYVLGRSSGPFSCSRSMRTSRGLHSWAMLPTRSTVSDLVRCSSTSRLVPIRSSDPISSQSMNEINTEEK